ncbi:MAG: glycosyltransferase, partial [bacterium]|nr:glycosyltransferase [bacterium]
RDSVTHCKGKIMKIVITGGHFTPAWATMTELLLRGHTIVYFGRQTSMEGDRGLSFEASSLWGSRVRFVSMVTARLQRRFTIYTIPSLLKFPAAFLQALFELLAISPDRVCSFGGSLALPVVLAAWILRVPIILHEQTLSPGIANRFLSRFSRRVAVSFPETASLFGSKAVVIGNPVRKEIFQTRPSSKEVTAFLNRADKPIVYVAGGSQGSHAINLLVEQSLERLLMRFCVLHAVGTSTKTGDLPRLIKEQRNLSLPLQHRYLPVSSVGHADIGGVLHAARAVVGRSGANTAWEIALLGKPAVLFPLAISAEGEQKKHARWLVREGLAEVASDDMTPTAFVEMVATQAKQHPKHLDLPKDAGRKLADLVEE